MGITVSYKSLKESPVPDAFWAQIGLAGPDGSVDRAKIKKYHEVVGFSRYIVEAVETFPEDQEITILDCGCGKSYLSFVVNDLLTRQMGRSAYFIGVDTNDAVIQMCEQAREALGFDNMVFHVARALDFEPDRSVDVLIALHACNTATDEAIAKGISLRARYIMTIPCCQNQVRGQLKDKHPLADLTQFGLLKYAFASTLTDGLRSLILKGVGYEVKHFEVVPPKCTPKNVLIQARKIKRKREPNLSEYVRASHQFGVRIALENMLPEELREVLAVTDIGYSV